MTVFLDVDHFRFQIWRETVAKLEMDPTPFFVRLLAAVAPERRSEVLKYINKNDVRVIVDENTDRILFQADGKDQRIMVGLKCLARLWATAFAYFRIYTDVAAAKLANPKIRERDLRSSERMRQASEVLKWAIETDVALKWKAVTGLSFGSPRDSFPIGLPQPFAEAEYASDQHVADELSLMALGYILHHELAHLRLGHVPKEGVDSIVQEKDADREAANWLLDGLDDEWTPMFVKRALGVAIGLSWLASLNVYVGSAASETHPPAYDRLYQVLEQHVEDGGHPVWAMVSLILSLHLQNQQLSFGESVEFGSFKEATNYYVDQIAKLDDNHRK